MWFSVPLQVWLLLLGMLTFVYWYIRNQFSFWAKRGVPFSKPHWLFGTVGGWVTTKTSIAIILLNHYREFKSERFCGIWRFFSPTLVVMDPELINNILVKDFDIWAARGLPVSPESDPLCLNLIFMDGAEWKSMRSSSSPAYTPGKLKQMFQFLQECSESMKKYINDQLTVNDGVIEAGEMCRKFVTDVNGLSAFGIQFNSFNEDNLFFRKLKKELIDSSLKRRIAVVMHVVLTDLFKFLKMSLQSPKMTDFFLNIVKQNLEQRKKSNTQKRVFIDFLTDSQSTDQPLSDAEIKLLAGQLWDFFVGGFESTSKAIAHVFHELAVNQDIQDRLREEVRRTKAAGNGETTWDAMNNMKYLDMVVQETLRKYPVPLLFRTCVKPYRIPGTNVELPTGTMCFIPTYAIHHDPEYYPDPEKFDPERFTPEAKSRRPACTFLPFGYGPRICIGMRFGEHQIKAALITIVDNFNISLCEKSQHPLEFDPEDMFLSPKNGVWLRFSKYSSNSEADD